MRAVAPEPGSAGACHGTAVLSGRVGVLLRGPSGSGKSLIAQMLIDTGARLIADDRVYLTPRNGLLVARAPAAIAGLIELRGLGPVVRPYEPVAIIRLLADLVDAADIERMPEPEAFLATLAGVTVARQAVPVPGPGCPVNAALNLIRQAIKAVVDHKSLHLTQVSP